MGKPRYKHDCDKCVFLGHITFPSPHRVMEGTYPELKVVKAWTEEEHADLYCCQDRGSIGHSLIARFSSKGGNYASCPHTLVRRDYFRTEQSSAGPAIIAAYWFAVAKGLFPHVQT